MRSQREWAREYSRVIIGHAERWAERNGYELSREFTYPKLPMLGYDSTQDERHAWFVDSLMSAAHAVLVATDLTVDAFKRAREWQYATRCFWQACEYKAHGVPDASWHDEFQRMRGIMDDAARVIPFASEVG